MLVKISAFELTIDSSEINLQSLAYRLVEYSGQQFDERVYYFDRTSYDGFCVGVVITVKDQKSFCTLDVGTDGKKIIRVQNLDEHNQIMDFNFFAINLQNGIGVYQHYHQSAALSSVEEKIKHEARSLKEQLINNAIHAARQEKNRDLTAGEEKKISRKHKCILKISPIVSKENLRNVLREFSKIKGMEYNYTTLLPVVRDATPLGNRVAKKKETVVFSNQSFVETLSNEIVAALRTFQIGKGRVFVEDAEGRSKAIQMFDMPEVLWEEDYDEVVGRIRDIDPGEFNQNQYLREIVALFQDERYNHILMAELQDE